jgi:guanylate kinase
VGNVELLALFTFLYVAVVGSDSGKEQILSVYRNCTEKQDPRVDWKQAFGLQFGLKTRYHASMETPSASRGKPFGDPQGKPFESSQGKLVLLIGPTGVGKSVILKRLRSEHPELHFPRSATTRARRQGEGNELYHFVSEEQFDALLQDGKILEWALVHGIGRYGTMREEIIPYVETGQTVVREVDAQGFESIERNPLFAGPDAQYRLESIFILPESAEQIIAHVQKRAPMSEEELAKRLESMKKEMTFAPRCTYQIINKEGQLEHTYKQVEKLVTGA